MSEGAKSDNVVPKHNKNAHLNNKENFNQLSMCIRTV